MSLRHSDPRARMLATLVLVGGIALLSPLKPAEAGALFGFLLVAALQAEVHLGLWLARSLAVLPVAASLAMAPAILVLDEPTSNLDPRARRAMLGLLSGLQATLVVASHDMDLAWELCEEAVILDQGRVVAQGPCASLLRDHALLEGHGLEPPAAIRYGR